MKIAYIYVPYPDGSSMNPRECRERRWGGLIIYLCIYTPLCHTLFLLLSIIVLFTITSLYSYLQRSF